MIFAGICLYLSLVHIITYKVVGRELSRRILQTPGEPNNTEPLPAPSSSPTLDFAPPPPPASNTTFACCCRGGVVQIYNDTAPIKYQQRSDCCCGPVSSCCNNDYYKSSLLGSICGGGATCGIILVISGMVGVLCFTACLASTVMVRRRRRARNAGANAGGNGGSQNRYARGAQQTAADWATVNALTKEEENKLKVRKPEAAHVGSKEECPICLETSEVSYDSWAAFPCKHKCCRKCLQDMMRHGNRNSTCALVHCPLCRTLSIVGSVKPSSPENTAGDVLAERNSDSGLAEELELPSFRTATQGDDSPARVHIFPRIPAIRL